MKKKTAYDRLREQVGWERGKRKRMQASKSKKEGDRTCKDQNKQTKPETRKRKPAQANTARKTELALARPGPSRHEPAQASTSHHQPSQARITLPKPAPACARYPFIP